MANLANIAATNMEHLCNCPEHGYSQSERWGDASKGTCQVKCEGHTSNFYKGDRDCSSAIIDSWQEALIGTKYEGKLAGATYTGDMRQVFINSGLFEWKPMSFNAVRGDIYLNEANHTAMCLDGGNDNVYGYDCLGEFALAETGGIHGKSGDQTGGESVIHGYYNYPWNGILHYNGKANTNSTNTKPANKKTLNGIDIASHQDEHNINIAQVEADFVIVKVSGGSAAHPYVNPLWKQNADKVLKAGKLLGLYHFAGEYGEKRTGTSEAEHFLKQIKGYENKAILCLDWEETAESFPVSYAKEWLDTVAKKTGATPLFYARAGYINEVNCSSIKQYPLWMASYLNKYTNSSGYVNKPDNTWSTGAWSKMTIYQYSSTRKIKGYSWDLDCNIFYGTKEDWKKLCGTKTSNSNSIKVSPQTQSTKEQPEYAVYTEQNKWLETMEGLTDSSDSNDDYAGIIGNNCIYIGINGVGDYRVYTESNKWLSYVDHFDKKDEENGMAGDGSNILALEIPNSNIKYQVHTTNGEWHDWMIGNKDTGNSKDTFAGDLKNPIDAVRITRI